LFVDGREFLFDPASGLLNVEGEPRRGSMSDVRFSTRAGFLVRFVLSCDRTALPPTGLAPHRERSTFVGEAFLQAQAEELQARRHVWEVEEVWATRGLPLRYPVSR
jgi:hypothetical protein